MGDEITRATLLSPVGGQGCLGPRQSQSLAQPQPRAGAQGSRALEEARAGPVVLGLSDTPSLNSCPLPCSTAVPHPGSCLSHLKYEAPARIHHKALGQAGKRALGSSTAGSAPGKGGTTARENKE